MAKLNCGTFELYYEDSGGAGEPVVLLHGSWGDHHQWDAVAGRLAPTYRVLSYDRRGHGASAAPGKPMALAEQVTDLSMLLSVIGRGPVHVVANGTGASISLALALQRPDQVRSLNLHEPPLFGLLAGEAESSELYQGVRALEDRTVRLLRAGDRAGAAQGFANGASSEPGGWAELPPEVQRSFAENGAATLKESEDPATQNLELSRFAAYRDPIVLTGGARSASVYASVREHLNAGFYGALQFSFPAAGHFPHVTHPEEFAHVAGEFCRYASRRSA
jgi:pimeloyl-ACP methyl ester carboxylesterase